MMRAVFCTLAILCTCFAFASSSSASGIFTLRGKLKAFNETTYTIQTKAIIYEIKKSGLSEAQLEELKKRKTGQDVELVVSTEAVIDARDVKK